MLPPGGEALEGKAHLQIAVVECYQVPDAGRRVEKLQCVVDQLVWDRSMRVGRIEPGDIQVSLLPLGPLDLVHPGKPGAPAFWQLVSM